MPIPIIKNMGKTCFNERFSFFYIRNKNYRKGAKRSRQDEQGLKIAKTFDRRLERSGQFIEKVVSMLSIMGASTVAQK